MIDLVEIYVEEISAASNDIKITFLLTNAEGALRESLVVSPDFYVTLDISKGECSAELYDRTESEARIYEAYKKGLRILSYGSCSRKRLISKIHYAGYHQDYAVLAANRLEELGFFNEQASADRFAEQCVTKHWGEQRISSELASRGYSSKTIAKALGHLADIGVDFYESCRLLLKSKNASKPQSFEEARKLLAMLYRCGYSAGISKSVISEME